MTIPRGSAHRRALPPLITGNVGAGHHDGSRPQQGAASNSSKDPEASHATSAAGPADGPRCSDSRIRAALDTGADGESSERRPSACDAGRPAMPARLSRHPGALGWINTYARLGAVVNLMTAEHVRPECCSSCACRNVAVRVYQQLPALSQDSPRSPRRLADAIVGRVMPKLRDLRRVPSGLQVVLNDTAPVWTLSRTTNALVGRAIELEMVLASLRRHGAAVISGGPGEGKTTVAMQAAARLCAEEPGLTAFALDMRGLSAALAECQMCLFSRHHLYYRSAHASCCNAKWLFALQLSPTCLAGVVAVPDDVSDDTGERGGLALSLCRQHATETLAPCFMHWLARR